MILAVFKFIPHIPATLEQIIKVTAISNAVIVSIDACIIAYYTDRR